MTTPAVTPYLKDGVELDQIIVQGIRVTGFHGVYAPEKETGQLFLADVVAHVSTRAYVERIPCDRRSVRTSASQPPPSVASCRSLKPSRL